jgi:hypothetical protein
VDALGEDVDALQLLGDLLEHVFGCGEPSRDVLVGPRDGFAQLWGAASLQDGLPSMSTVGVQSVGRSRAMAVCSRSVMVHPTENSQLTAVSRSKRMWARNALVQSAPRPG